MEDGTGVSERNREVTGEQCQTVMCSIRDVLDRIGDKWSVLVVVTLNEGTHRFSELLRAIDGISQRMLTRTLRLLERDGLVHRSVHPTVPPRVEYRLTELGRTLIDPLHDLAAWAGRHRPTIQAARERFDRGSQVLHHHAPHP